MVGIYVVWIQVICTILLALIPPALVGATLNMGSWDLVLMGRSMCLSLSIIHLVSFKGFLFYLFKFCSCLFLLFRSSAMPKKVDILEGMHVIRWVFIFSYCSICFFNCTYGMWWWISFPVVLHVEWAIPWWWLIEQMLVTDLIRWLFKNNSRILLLEKCSFIYGVVSYFVCWL